MIAYVLYTLARVIFAMFVALMFALIIITPFLAYAP